jgi:hypothetical protein
MKYILYLVLVFNALSCGTSEKPMIRKKEKCSYSIYLDEYKRYYNFSEYITDVIIINPTENKYAKIVLFDCKGAMSYEGYKDSLLYIVGNYVSAKQLTIINVSQENLFNPGEIKQVKEKVYEPTRSGEWKYYDKGKLIATNHYNAGVLVKIDSVKH